MVGPLNIENTPFPVGSFGGGSLAAIVGVVGALDPPNMEKKPFPGSCDSEANGLGELSSAEVCVFELLNIDSSPPPGASVAEEPGRMPPSIDDPVCSEVAPPNIENKPLLD